MDIWTEESPKPWHLGDFIVIFAILGLQEFRHSVLVFETADSKVPPEFERRTGLQKLYIYDSSISLAALKAMLSLPAGLVHLDLHLDLHHMPLWRESCGDEVDGDGAGR